MNPDNDQRSPDENPTVPGPPSRKTGGDTHPDELSGQSETGPFRSPPAAAGEAREVHAPRTFGRYRVERVYRSGGFGTVFLGHDPQLDRKVAIKVPRPDRLQNSSSAFLEEARRVARLRHPGIVTVHDTGLEGEHCYIVSDFVEGTPLHEWLNRGRPSWRQAVRIVAAVADALAHAHAQNTVHRDIKPSNIILTENETPMLIDFGLALTEREPTAPTGGSVGTPAYMSPEQAAGKGHRLDGRTDIYSLGVVLYEMLCGRRPHRALDMDELVRQVCEDEAQPPRQVVRNIPREVERICLKAMAKRIGDRYTTASDLADELRDVLETYLEAPPSGTTQAPVESGRQCPRCGWANVAEAQFCGGCGVGLTEQPAEVRRAGSVRDRSFPPIADTPGFPRDAAVPNEAPAVTTPRTAERRQVTALFCGFDLSESLDDADPEDQQEQLLVAARACKDVVAHWQGTTLDAAGEGVLAVFGYPVALEDAARRAVRAALAIQEAMNKLKEQRRGKKSFTLSCRACIHTGFALVGDWTGGDSGAALTVVGEARNVATRLEALAERGMVVISTATHRLVQGFFECAELGTHELKGLARPMDVFQVLRPSKVRHNLEAAAMAGLTPLVGRDQEVGLLRDRWEQALEGMGQVVLLVGEAGIGKSRLIHTLKEQLIQGSAGRGDFVVEWRCSPSYQNTALYPAADFFETLLGFQREDAPRARLDKLVDHLRSLRMDEPDVVPLFAALLSVPLDQRYPPLNLSPQGQKERTLDALANWLQRYARRQSVLFIVEDLHWVDASTQEFLTRLMAQSDTERLLTIFTFRPEYAPPWTSRTPQTQVVLTRLTRRQIADLMQRKIGAGQLPAALVEQVAARTDGVPLFVEEFTRMVVETGSLRVVDGQVEWTDALPEHAIPATLQDLLAARLDRMASIKEVVQLGATLGRTFRYELLRAVAAVDEPTLRRELDKLVEADILHQKGQPPRCAYQFKHALIEEAAYQSLLRSHRQQFHLRVAKALEQQFPEIVQTQPEVAARHYTEAGLAREALVHWEAAALHCQDRSANTEGIGHLRRGLDLLAGLEESPRRDRQELRFQVLLAAMLQAVRGYAAPEVSAVHSRARELSERIGDPVLHFQVLWGTWSWRFIRDELDLGMELVDQMLRLARSQPDPGLLMEACFAEGCNRFYRGDFSHTRTYCEQGFELYTPERGREHVRHTGQNAGVTNQCYSGVALWFLGHPDQAETRIGQALSLARELKHPFTLVFALYHHALLQQLLRRGDEAQASGEALESLSVEQGFPFWMALGLLCRGAGSLFKNKFGEAAALIREGLQRYRATGAGVTVSHYHGLLAAAHLGAGQIAEATAALADGFAVTERFNERFVEAELHRLRAELLLARADSDPAETEACLRRALEVASARQAKSLELRAAMTLHHWRRTAETRETLARVFAWFREGTATADLKEARKLLDERA